MFPFLLTTSLLFVAANCNEESPRLSIDDGIIKGSYRVSRDGRKYIAFEGIPYAQPPIQDLRFEDPQPVKPWPGVLDTTKTYICMQVDRGDVTGTEDCLYLNVYIPRETIDAEENLDVVVHIHGGAFMMGDPKTFASPGLIMDRDVIYVTMNYRVGIFGFYSTGNGVSNGNFGLKDQAAALKWIQKNIQHFGGNKNSVTITGLSAGGASVHLHYFSNLSKGLFHKGFAQSGVALDPWAIQKRPERMAEKIATAVGCAAESIECLKRRPAVQIMSTLKGDGLLAATPLFAPTIEPDLPSSFLVESPYSQLLSKKVFDVPFLTSVVTEDGTIPCGILYGTFETFNELWDMFMPSLLNYDFEEERKNEISTKIREHYLKGEELTAKNFDKIVKICTDRVFHIGAERSAKIQSNITDSKVYFLMMGYIGQGNALPMLGIKANLGVGHGTDGRFYYENFPMGPPQLNEEETRMKDILLDMLVSFAKTGQPTIEGIEFKPVAKSGNLDYLLIKNPDDISMESTEGLGSMEFWNSLRIRDYGNVPLNS